MHEDVALTEFLVVSEQNLIFSELVLNFIFLLSFDGVVFNDVVFHQCVVNFFHVKISDKENLAVVVEGGTYLIQQFSSAAFLPLLERSLGEIIRLVAI